MAKYKTPTLKVTVEIEYDMDLDALDWYCNEITGEPDLDIIANHLDAPLGPSNHTHQPHYLRVASARWGA